MGNVVCCGCQDKPDDDLCLEKNNINIALKFYNKKNMNGMESFNTSSISESSDLNDFHFFNRYLH